MEAAYESMSSSFAHFALKAALMGIALLLHPTCSTEVLINTVRRVLKCIIGIFRIL